MEAHNNISGVLNLSASSCSDISQLEMSLEEAEEKIANLLKVKEKLVVVQVLIFQNSLRIIQGGRYFLTYLFCVRLKKRNWNWMFPA